MPVELADAPSLAEMLDADVAAHLADPPRNRNRFGRHAALIGDRKLAIRTRRANNRRGSSAHGF
jgi:hypothetical protein